MVNSCCADAICISKKPATNKKRHFTRMLNIPNGKISDSILSEM